MTNDALNWYVAYVRSCQEKKSAEALAKLGVEHYLPVQTVMKRYSDRIRKVEQLVLPRMIFIRTDEKRRIMLLNEVYGIHAYMTNGGAYHPVTVPDRQMEDFRFMVENGGGRVQVSTRCFAPGDTVKVVSGPLGGLVCRIVSVGARRCVAVSLGALGTAILEIPPEDLMPASI